MDKQQKRFEKQAFAIALTLNPMLFRGSSHIPDQYFSISAVYVRIIKCKLIQLYE